MEPIPVAACLLELWVRIPPGAGKCVPYECCVLSGTDLCNGPIPRPQEYHRASVGHRVWTSGTESLYSYSDWVEEVGLRDSYLMNLEWERCNLGYHELCPSLLNLFTSPSLWPLASVQKQRRHVSPRHFVSSSEANQEHKHKRKLLMSSCVPWKNVTQFLQC